VRNNSAGAVIHAPGKSGKLSRWQERLKGNDEVISFISDNIDTCAAIVAIDAPLLVPNQTGTRPCDRQLTREFRKYHAGTYPAYRQKFRDKVRGEEIVRQLTTLNFNHNPHLQRQTEARRVVEVYPHPATIVLFNLPRILQYKTRQGRDLEYRQKELGRLQAFIRKLKQATPALEVDKSLFHNPDSLYGRAFKVHEDLLDSILCAYIAYHAWYWGPEGYRIFGEENWKEGYILVPRLPALP
jgi:predicted RNase H-like nuclease